MPGEQPIAHYLSAAAAITSARSAHEPQEGLPYHQALLAFELAKRELCLRSSPTPQRPLDRSELAHTPVLLSPLARSCSYGYAVHRRPSACDTHSPSTTHLLIYRDKNRSVDFIELQSVAYTAVVALELASGDGHPLSATELLLELAQCRDIDNVVQFVEQGLKLLTQLNELGLIRRGIQQTNARAEASVHSM